MKVRTRLVGLLLFLAGAFLVSLFAVRYFQIVSMEMIATNRERELRELLDNVIRLDGQTLANFAADYTFWDDMAEFARRGDPKWAHDNLDGALGLFNAHAAWVFNQEFQPVYQIAAPQMHGPVELPVPDRGRRGLFSASPFTHFFALLPQGVAEVRGATIHPSVDSKRETPAQGYFFVCRLWNDKVLRELSSTLHGSVNLNPDTAAGPWPDSEFRHDGTFVFHRQLLGLNGEPVALLEVRNQAPLFLSAIRATKLEFAVCILFTATLVILLSLALYYWIQQPLRAISRSLHNGDPGPIRAYLRSQTEFGHVARLIHAFFQQKSELIAEIGVRKQAQQDLAATEANLRVLLDSTSDWIFLTDAEGRFLTVNGAVAQGLGVNPEDIAGRSVFEFARKEYVEVRRAQLEDVVRTGQPLCIEVPFDNHFFELSAHPILGPGGEVLRLALFARNITERKQHEEALRKSEERFRKYFELPLIGVAMVTPDMHWIDFNEKLSLILGYSRQELERLTWADLTYREDLPSNLDIWNRALRGELDSISTEGRFVRKDGTVAYGEVSALCIRKEDGAVDYVVALVQDITGRKQAEEERAQLEEQLRQAQRLESIGRLAGGIAHDFNNLLSPIMGYTDLAVLKLAPDSPLRDDLDQVRRAAERMRDLTRRFLTFARKQVLEMRIISLNLVVADFDAMLRRLIGEDIQVITRLEPALGNIRADSSQLQQIIINLAVNARDAMPEGGALHIETANVWLNDAYAGAHAGIPGGAYVVLTVSDTGCGMPEDVREHIFEPFFTTKDIGKGTGLGLATVYGIVRQHLGGIAVESEPGKGSTFRVYLPRVDRDLSQTPPAPEPVVERGDETVLVVEDDDGVRQVVADLLAEHGYQVLSAANGSEALLLAEEFADPIHLLLTDMIMPGMNGRELHRRIALARPDVKVLYMSGYTGDTAFLHGVQEGQLEFMRKPFLATELTHRVREVLEKDAAAQAGTPTSLVGMN